jgi:putative ABC transport system substrate-binding protein
MAFDSDPVGSGFVDSLARPGGRITGLSFVAPEISAKQVDVLRQIIPQLSRLAILGDSKEPGNARGLEETKQAAEALGIRVQYVDARASRSIEETFAAAGRERAQAVIVLPSPFFAPAAGPHYVEVGGLVSYSANINELFRRAAVYVDKILKGAKPAELPVEQPHTFELVVNAKTAKEIGLVVPMGILSRADRVIQ